MMKKSLLAACMFCIAGILSSCGDSPKETATPEVPQEIIDKANDVSNKIDETMEQLDGAESELDNALENL